MEEGEQELGDGRTRRRRAGNLWTLYEIGRP